MLKYVFCSFCYLVFNIRFEWLAVFSVFSIAYYDFSLVLVVYNCNDLCIQSHTLRHFWLVLLVMFCMQSVSVVMGMDFVLCSVFITGISVACICIYFAWFTMWFSVKILILGFLCSEVFEINLFLLFMVSRWQNE